MKRIFLTIILSSPLLFIACKKDHTCTCRSADQTNKIIDLQQYGRSKVNEANKQCTKLQEINQLSDSSITCKLEEQEN